MSPTSRTPGEAADPLSLTSSRVSSGDWWTENTERAQQGGAAGVVVGEAGVVGGAVTGPHWTGSVFGRQREQSSGWSFQSRADPRGFACC